jgi:hypothetical protein
MTSLESLFNKDSLRGVSMNSKIIQILIIVFLIPQSLWAENQKVNGLKVKELSAEELAVQIQTQIDSLMFRDFADLDTSFAIRKEDGRIFLIIEIDHNIHGNYFVLNPAQAGIDKAGETIVAKENLAFGFNNKNVVYLPVLEMAANYQRTDLFVLNKANNRTQQQIDITKLLNAASVANSMVDVNSGTYSLSDIHEIAFGFKVSKTDGPTNLEFSKVDLKALKDGETLLIYGKTPVESLALFELDISRQNFKPKLSSPIIYRYFSPFVRLLLTGKNLTTYENDIKLVLLSMPLEFDDMTIERLAKKLSQIEYPQEFVSILINEQYQAQNPSQAPLMCKNLFQ